jgi:hypothetical protein
VSEFEVGADISISIGEALRDRPEVRASTPPAAVLAGMSRTATSGPRLRWSQVITASASAENQQLMRKITSG